MLIIMTRWHVDDLLGRYIDRMEGIRVLSYPAIAENDTQYRKAGEALFPELKPLEFLEERRKIPEPCQLASAVSAAPDRGWGRGDPYREAQGHAIFRQKPGPAFGQIH